MERASLYENLFLGIEATPGDTAAVADKWLRGVTFDMGLKVQGKQYKTTGGKFTGINVPNKEWSEVSLSGPLTYTDIIYPLSGVIAAPTIVADSGFSTWTWKPRPFWSDGLKTFIFDVGSQGKMDRLRFGLMQSLSIELNREEATWSVAALAGKVEEGVVPYSNETYSIVKTGTVTGGTFTLVVGGQTATVNFDDTANEIKALLEALSTVGVGNVNVTGGPAPSVAVVITFQGTLAQTAVTMTTSSANITGGGSMVLTNPLHGDVPDNIAAIPVAPFELLVYTATTQAGLDGATAQSRNFSIRFGCSDRQRPVWVHNADRSYAANVETMAKWDSSFLVAADAEGMGYFADLQEGNVIWVRARMIGPVITGNTRYQFTVDLCASIVDIGKFQDQDGVYAIEFMLDPLWDATFAGAISYELITDLAAL